METITLSEAIKNLEFIKAVCGTKRDIEAAEKLVDSLRSQQP